MDEVDITREPIRKHARIGNKCDVPVDRPIPRSPPGIASLPTEIIFEILSYLSPDDLRVVGRVSVFFDRLVRDPFLWRSYEVTNNGTYTGEVLNELKRMPFLRKLVVNGRSDCDDILRQISLTNKNLAELYVSNCTGSSSKLYLQSRYLVRILERCRALHTIFVSGNRFRGRKFYRLLGEIGGRLKAVYMPATRSQFCTFIKHGLQIGEADRETICSVRVGANSWAPLYYIVTKHREDRVALISYLQTDVVWIDAADRPAEK